MNPTALWTMICENLTALEHDPDHTDERENAVTHLRLLADWLWMGGFPPKLT